MALRALASCPIDHRASRSGEALRALDTSPGGPPSARALPLRSPLATPRACVAERGAIYRPAPGRAGCSSLAAGSLCRLAPLASLARPQI